MLAKKGLENMDSLGKEFDTDFHEALTEIPAPTKKLRSKVVDVIEKGYLLNGKVIRFAKVVVDAKNGVVLGATVIGVEATEIVSYL